MFSYGVIKFNSLNLTIFHELIIYYSILYASYVCAHEYIFSQYKKIMTHDTEK